MGAYVAGVGAYVPPRTMTNEELGEIVDTSDEWIYSHTGIRRRHIADESSAASDLAVEAAGAALRAAKVAPNEIDLILLATSTPDYPGLPSTAAIVQDRMGAHNAGAMDIVAACTGFVYGLSTAAAYVESGMASIVLVIGSEVYSKILDWTDRNTCVLFGDGAGAAVVMKSENPGIVGSHLRSKGSGAMTLLRREGGSRAPFAPGVSEVDNTKLYMDGRRVYMFAIQAILDTIETLLADHGLTIEQIDHIVPHQANIRIIEAACKRAGYSQELFYTNMEEYANTSAASIPIALSEMVDKGLLKRGQRLITVGFGAGLTYGGNLIEW